MSYPSNPKLGLSADKEALLELMLKDEGVAESPSPRISRRQGDLRPPLSFAQERLWFLDQLDPGNRAYHIPIVIRLNGSVHVGALEKSLNEIVRRHESLRSTFPTVDGQAVNVIARELILTLELIGLEDIPANKRETAARRIAVEQSHEFFDLARGPLVRVCLMRLNDEEHWLLAVMHHIVTDGWSLSIFVRELAALYNAFSTDNPSSLPEIPVQYGDFAHWQRQWLKGDVLENQLAYWKERLSDSPPVLELPTDRPRPALRTFRGARQSLTLPRRLGDALQTLSQQAKATPFIVLLAALQSLLLRYTGEDDISVGSPIAGRNRPEVEGLIGFFVNTLVLRTVLAGNPSFRELLARVRDVALGAYAHQDLPFEKLVAALQPERDLSHTPLFQVMFAFQNVPGPNFEVRGLTLRREFIDTETAMFDLTLFVHPLEEGLQVWLEYNTDLFDAVSITRMLGHFQTLLEGIVANPEQRLSDLPLLTEAERLQLLVEWNATGTEYPKEVCLHRLFEAQVERTPDAVAVEFEEKQLTYRELNHRANQLARKLRARGVGPEVLVGVFAERSFEMVVSLLAVLKSGGAYVPLDPSYPAERLRHMLEDARAPLVLAQPNLVNQLPTGASQVLELDASWTAYAGESVENLQDAGTPENLAYVIFTSGSTGRPKGAMNAHRGICNRLLWMQEEYALNDDDRVLQKTPFSFDVSVWEFFWPLLTGARLVIARPEGHKDAGYLVRLIREGGITTMHFVPSMMRVFLEEEGVEGCSSLRRVICSGEALPHELQERFFARLPGVELHNLYGPTEAAVDVTYWACQRGDERLTVPIGRPVANTQIYVLDAQMRPVPVGVPGELYIGGVQVGRGYVGRDDLTAERFVPDPFSRTPGARLYKTGDLTRHLADGAIEYLGRLDYQVKIRGQRIELGEIEATLDKHAGVGQSSLVVREDVPGDQRLVAYVVARDAALSAAELKAHLAQTLPAYMIPSTFVFLEALPLTSSGKVDRRRLPKPVTTAIPIGEHEAPADPAEAAIAGIWTRLIQPARMIGRHDRFFEMGGHSLLAVQALREIEQALSVKLELRVLFRESLADIAARCRSQGGTAEGAGRSGGAKPELVVPAFEAFYFGPSNRRLFASYHPATGDGGHVLTVICPPLFSEFTRTHFALRKLAITLARRGQHVLRFDYRGTGDSYGDLDEVTISDWVEDIALAVGEGRELSGSKVVQLVGVRAGALLACRSVGRLQHVRKMVLWDPVPDGAGYLQALRRVQVGILDRNIGLKSQAERLEAMQDYAGYRLSERMLEEFRLLDSSAYTDVPKSKLHVVSTMHVNGFPVAGVPNDVAEFACKWEQDTEDLIFAQPVLERLIACLTLS